MTESGLLENAQLYFDLYTTHTTVMLCYSARNASLMKSS